MDDKNLVDLSSFLLFEATDDNSEVLDHSPKSSSLSKFSPEDDSDAMSCSYDESEKVDVHGVDDGGLVDDFVNQDLTLFKEKCDNGFCCYVECGQEDEEEGVVDQELKKSGDHQPNKVPEKPTKSSVVCVESCEELMRRREQDKLFWKSCLDS